MENNTTDLKSFSYLENGRVNFSVLNTIETTKQLKPGLYSLLMTESWQNPEIILKKEEIKEIHNLINYHFVNKIEEIYLKFFDKNIKKQVNSLNYNHKVGLLLFGKQGTAKTSILKHFYVRSIEEYGALVFYFAGKKNFNDLWDVISNVRKIQNNPIIIFLDEFDEFFTEAKLEESFKLIMDGQKSIDNCMFLGATNYIDKIPETIKDRPSRIKHLIEVEGLSDEALVSNFIRENLAKVEINLSEEEILKIIKTSLGKTIDELKEIILDIVMNIKTTKFEMKKVGFKN